MQLTSNVFMVSGQPYASFQNVYAVRGPSGVVLVDTGADERELGIIDRNLQRWGLGQVTDVVLTHAHMTHTSNAHVFRERGARVIAGRGAAEVIQAGTDGIIDYDEYNFLWDQWSFVPCQVDHVVADGDQLAAAGLTFDVTLFDGHSVGCIVVSVRDGDQIVLLTGDVFCPGPTNRTAILGWTGSIDYDEDLYVEDLKRLATLSADVVLGGHHQPCLVDGTKLLRLGPLRVLRAHHPTLNRNVWPSV